MPREWHDRHAVNTISDPAKRKLYQRIVADKKPYFMRVIYPKLNREYNTYIKNTNKSAMREFQMTVDELLSLDEDELTERQQEYIRYYKSGMPVSTNDCVMNKICRRFEEEFDGYLGRRNAEFDYGILKCGAEYSQAQFNAIRKLYDGYNSKLRNFVIYSNYERVDDDESSAHISSMKESFVSECSKVCPNQDAMCDILLDICYCRNKTKSFAWDICGDVIIRNLLRRNHWTITYPAADEHGDIEYCGRRFTLKKKEVAIEA